MAATNSARVAVKQRLLDLLQSADGLVSLPGNAVTYSQPRNDIATDAVWIGDINGVESGIATPIKSGRAVRNDAFTVNVEIVGVAKGDKTGDAADARVLEIFGWVEDVIAESRTLGSLPGVLFCQLEPYDGPNPVELPGGSGARITVPVLVSTQLR